MYIPTRGDDSMAFDLNLHIYFPEVVHEHGNFFRSAWRILGQFGNIQANGYVCKSDGTPIAEEGKPQIVRLGLVEELTELFDDDQCEIYGGLDAKLIGSQGDSDIGLSLDATNAANICFSKHLLMTYGTEHCLDVVKSILELADSLQATYGLIDYSPTIDSEHGSNFSSVINLQMPFQQWVMRERWYCHAKACGKVRSVYWGNYLSNAMLARLEEDFVNRYTRFAVDGGGWPNAHIWQLSNGAFISISLDPLFDRDDTNMLDFQVMRNTNWIIKEFCDSGLF